MSAAAAAVPATWVPCPISSSTSELLSTKSQGLTILPTNSLWSVSIPESIIAMVVLLPVTPEKFPVPIQTSLAPIWSKFHKSPPKSGLDSKSIPKSCSNACSALTAPYPFCEENVADEDDNCCA